ncbi:ABC transporter ATP-binding protein [soil metagenome]
MILSAQHLSYAHRGVPALDDVSFAFPRGKVTAIIGPNGAGKTTLLRILSGLVAPDSGSVLIGDTPLARLTANERARRIGYLPQSGQGVWNVTARELVALGRLPHRSRFAGPSATDEAAIQTALDLTDTAKFADRPLNAMSGGERARVLLARVIAGEPVWLLADEPLNSLDPRHQQRMLQLMRAVATEGRGVITVLHDLNAAATADMVIMLSAGRIVAAGRTAEAFTAETLAATYGMSFSLQKGKNGQTLVGNE